MPAKHVFFRITEDRLTTHNEYIYIANYKYTHPDEQVTLVVFEPSHMGLYENLACFSGIDILGLKSVGIIEENTYPMETCVLSQDLLQYPFFNSVEYMSRGINADMAILDIGCGDKALSNQFPLGKVTTVDAYEKFNPDVLHNLANPLPFQTASYDVALLLDVIEHLDKESGFRLLEEIKRVVRKRFFVLTPLHWRENEEETNNPNSPYFHNTFNLHHSLWKPEDFKDFTRVHNPIMIDYFFGYWENKCK